MIGTKEELKSLLMKIKEESENANLKLNIQKMKIIWSYHFLANVYVLSHFSHVWLFATPWTVVAPPGSSVHGILQARILELITISFSRVSSWPMDRTLVTYVSCIGRQVLYQ